jgi:hypothetical protein
MVLTSQKFSTQHRYHVPSQNDYKSLVTNPKQSHEVEYIVLVATKQFIVET